MLLYKNNNNKNIIRITGVPTVRSATCSRVCVWSKQGLFNCYLTIIHKYIRCTRKEETEKKKKKKKKVWKQSKNWLFCSGFKVSKYLSRRHRCLSRSNCPRRFPPFHYFFIFLSHNTHKYIFIVVWLHTSNMINRIVCLSRREIRQNIRSIRSQAPFSHEGAIRE